MGGLSPPHQITLTTYPSLGAGINIGPTLLCKMTAKDEVTISYVHYSVNLGVLTTVEWVGFKLLF